VPASPSTTTGGVPRYGAGGVLAEAIRVRPMALSAHA
jgi:hypothetical protein